MGVICLENGLEDFWIVISVILIKDDMFLEVQLIAEDKIEFVVSLKIGIGMLNSFV
jgi:hypothetical protein